MGHRTQLKFSLHSNYRYSFINYAKTKQTQIIQADLTISKNEMNGSCYSTALPNRVFDLPYPWCNYLIQANTMTWLKGHFPSTTYLLEKWQVLVVDRLSVSLIWNLYLRFSNWCPGTFWTQHLPDGVLINYPCLWSVRRWSFRPSVRLWISWRLLISFF